MDLEWDTFIGKRQMPSLNSRFHRLRAMALKMVIGELVRVQMKTLNSRECNPGLKGIELMNAIIMVSDENC